MRLWIYLVFAVLCSCNAQNEDSLGRLPDGWDDYDDDWYNGDFDEAVASKEILDEKNDEEPPNASVQDIVEDLPLEETDKLVDEEIQKFLQETKDENPFKDYQIEDNRSNNQDEKSLQNNSPYSQEDTLSSEANNDDSIKIEDINDGEQPQDEDLEMSLLKPNYDTDQEVIEDDQSAIEPSREINDALSDLDDEDVLKAVEELKQISAQLDATVNDVVNATNEEQRNLEQQKQESTDEEIPSAPEEPIQGYEDIITYAKRILNETEDVFDFNKEAKSDLNSQQEPEEKQDSIIEKDIETKVDEIGSDQVLQIKEDESLEVNKTISSEINISEGELENVLKENQELDDDLKQLFAIRDDEPENSKEIEDFDITEVDFDKLFDEMKSQEKIAAETVKTSHENIVEAKENNTSAKEDKEPTQIVEEKDSSVQSKPLEKNVENQEISDVIKEKDESTVEKTTKINKVESKKVEELTSSEFQDLLDQFTANHQDDLDITSKSFNKDVAPVYIELSAVNIETVTSPGYPSPYPTNNIIDWVFEGNGTGIEMNITDFDVNGALGDYLLIKPGGLDDSRNDGIIITHHLSSERRFRFASVNKLFVRFEAKQGMAFKKGFSFNIKMLFPPTEDEIEDVTEVPTLPPPLHTLTVYLGGVSLPQFLQMQEDFRILVADMATLYINSNGIEAQNTTSSVTQLIATTLCNVNWPGVENCVEVRFAVPVSHDEEDPRLNEEDLQAMWYTYVYLDPFAARLRQMGISDFSVPNAGAMLSVWLVIGLGVLISMTMLAFVLWRYSCVENYTRMQNLSDTGSIGAEKRPLDLYPTPHQTLPPLYSDMYKYPYGDATVDMDGFNNQGYAQDNLFDIDSDEEAIKRERNQSSQGISARDIYKI